MSTKQNTMRDASKQSYRANKIKPIIIGFISLVALIACVFPCGATGFGDYTNTAYNLVAFQAFPSEGDERVYNLSNPIGGIELPIGTGAQTLRTIITMGDDIEANGNDYLFGLSDVQRFSGVFCLNYDQALSIYYNYEGGTSGSSYEGSFYYYDTSDPSALIQPLVTYTDENGNEQPQIYSGDLSISLDGQWSTVDLDMFDLAWVTNQDTRLYYFIGDINIQSETYLSVSVGMMNLIDYGDNLSYAFKDTPTFEIYERPPEHFTSNTTGKRTAYIYNGVLYYTPYVTVDVEQDLPTFDWLLDGVGSFFNVPLFGENLTLGAFLTIGFVFALVAVILKLAFGG